MTTQKDIIAELTRELAMRRRVWREIPGSPGQFPNIDHTRQFAAMSDLLELMRAMQAAEFQLITNRVARLKGVAAKQPKLFK